jgi:hypothetical protein
MKKVFLALALGAFLWPVEASAEFGSGYVDDNPGGWEILMLNNGNKWYQFGGTTYFCGSPGLRYQTMRRVLYDRGSNQGIEWWVDASCGNYKRVCLRNTGGEVGCSTYYFRGTF